MAPPACLTTVPDLHWGLCVLTAQSGLCRLSRLLVHLLEVETVDQTDAKLIESRWYLAKRTLLA
jgi:hypothetical protein